MKQLLILSAVICIFSCKAQQTAPSKIDTSTGVAADTIEAFNGEFDVYQNGLIYSPTTVRQLTHIVDSLNLKFKRCDLNKPFLSIRQGIAWYVQINKAQARSAAKDMKAGMGLAAILEKYKTGKTADSLHVIISKEANYENEMVYYFTGLRFKKNEDLTISKTGKTDYTTAPLAGQWITEYPMNSDVLEAIYFEEEPRSQPIPEKYARMILYSECVIDTTTDIYTGPEDGQGYFGRFQGSEESYKKTSLYAFENYLEKSTAHITPKQLPAAYKQWPSAGLDSMKKAYVRNTLSKQPEFRTRLEAAIAEWKEGKLNAHDELEYYVANYHSKKTALEMKRRRFVMGNCSMDQGPRMHAQQIAMLSAEAVNWETFLRAHLNIMNDRFDRVSDGSWAYASRKTYIKELETLNLDVNDLLLGISLRTHNAADKHYYGDISRTGRALAETADKTKLVNILNTAVADEQLDVYNRMLMYYLLENYTYYLEDEAERKAAFRTLLDARKKLPGYVGRGILLEEKDFVDRDRGPGWVIG